jgi:hypothetical protein
MDQKALSRNEIDQFIERGFVMLRDAFSRAAARRVRDDVWKRMELREEEPSGWNRSMVHVRTPFGGPPYDEIFTPRLHGAFDDLMGAGGWKNLDTGLGWYVAFPGHDAPPWHVPRTGWHVEGDFQHRVDSPEWGLVPVFLFSDIGPGDGGTVIAQGTHRTTARILAAADAAGMGEAELNRRVAERPFEDVVEMNGSAGDVALMHPFVAHTRSINTGKSVRFICNGQYRLKERMTLRRADAGDHTPVERAVVAALMDVPHRPSPRY